MFEYILIETDAEYAEAAKLFTEYASWLNIDLGFQKFKEELTDLKSMYATPLGGIILCRNNQEFIASVAIRKIDTEIAELKRMYVKPAFQKRGIGKKLLEEAVLLASQSGYNKIRLDTLSNMTPAIDLYKRNGFYEIPAYYYNPESTAVYFEKTL